MKFRSCPCVYSHEVRDFGRCRIPELRTKTLWSDLGVQLSLGCTLIKPYQPLDIGVVRTRKFKLAANQASGASLSLACYEGICSRRTVALLILDKCGDTCPMPAAV